MNKKKEDKIVGIISTIFIMILEILWLSVLIIGLISMVDGVGKLESIDGVIMVSVWIIVEYWTATIERRILKKAIVKVYKND